MSTYRRIASLKTAADMRAHAANLGISLPIDDELESGSASPLGQPMAYKNQTIGNRFCILPMEGWDGTADGKPSDLTIRRWRNFGLSGAKLIWGGEAVAVRHDGRANPQQLVINDANLADLAGLREVLLEEHQRNFGRTDDLYIGLQLTHSGRFARPSRKDRMEPAILYRHPILDRKFNVPADLPPLTDDAIDRLIDDMVQAAKLAAKAGFAFVDIKHCHGYLGHEFLSAFDRPGKYGGSFENRTRFLRNIVAAISAEVPELDVGVRLSAIDWIPFRPGPDGTGEPEDINAPAYAYAFGGDGTGRGMDLREPIEFLKLLQTLGIQLVCISLGSPYYNPHIQRPALFPPSDGYQPPEDPLIGVARHIALTAELKKAVPGLLYVGSGYSYAQDWLAHVGQAAVRQGQTDFVGLGRMVLSYPDLPADVLAGRPLQRKKVCRTFSECTTGPRNGMVSGCYPLDPFYKERPEAKQIEALKVRPKSR